MSDTFSYTKEIDNFDIEYSPSIQRWVVWEWKDGRGNRVSGRTLLKGKFHKIEQAEEHVLLKLQDRKHEFIARKGHLQAGKLPVVYRDYPELFQSDAP